MKRFFIAPILAIATLAAGCAATDATPSSSEPYEQPEYRTGSSIPVHVARPKTQEERDRAAADAEQARRNAEKILRPGT